MLSPNQKLLKLPVWVVDMLRKQGLDQRLK